MPSLMEKEGVVLNADTCSEGQQCSAQKLCFKHKVRTLQFGTGVARQPTTREFRHPEKGYRIKQSKDEATARGNVITEHAKGERQDVLIRPDIQTVQASRRDFTK